MRGQEAHHKKKTFSEKNKEFLNTYDVEEVLAKAENLY
jgi:hypothetical protein